MRFSKWQGLGNDYVIVEESDLPGELTVERIGLLCDRHLGVGADGILVRAVPSGAVPGGIARMRIFNPDGSEPEMCGNGIRMFARYLAARGDVPAGDGTEAGDGGAGAGGGAFTVETLAGPVKPTLLADGRVRVEMGIARFVSPAIDAHVAGGPGEVIERVLAANGSEYVYTFVDVGNPHCVIFTEEPLPAVPVDTAGPAIERLPLFPARANVEFVRVEHDGSLSVRVWERGVGETRACGTGGTAVGAAAIRTGRAESPVVVRLPGGILEVEANGKWNMVMTGPAEEVFRGFVSPDLYARLGWSSGELEAVKADEEDS